MADEDSYGRASDPAGKTNLPGIFLIVTGIVNGLFAVWVLYAGTNLTRDVQDLKDPEKRKEAQEALEKEMAKHPDDERKQLEQMGWTPERIVGFMEKLPGGFFAYGGLVLVASLFVVLAGIRMMQHGSYGLAIFGSILALIPCVTSPCCILGIPFGIWSLVVLMSPEVKTTFR
jgi:hypothetical protein